jgi:hypothetical protein
VSYITRGGANVLGTTTGDITSDIAQLFAEDISTTFNFYGWQMATVARENLLIVTVPQTSETPNKQYVMNMSSNRWCLFSDMPMTCLDSIANWPMFGTADGRVCIGFTNYTDNNRLNGTVGVAINGLIQPAFSYFQKEDGISAQKHFLMVQPTFLSVNAPAYALQMNTDFNQGYATAPTGTPYPGGSLWDVARWDVGLWGGGSSVYKKWSSVEGVGFAGQLSLTTLVNSETTLTSIDYMLETGGPM